MTDDNAEQEAIIAGLSAPQARIAAKYFYDGAGSALFEEITRLPEYYPTRTEAAILQTFGPEIVRRLPAAATLIEPGAGNCAKVRALFPILRPQRFVAADIAGDFLEAAAAGLRRDFPGIGVHTLAADIASDLCLPDDIGMARRIVFYPGSSIGNFDPEEAIRLLRRLRRLLGGDGSLLIGVDLLKDPALLEAAYDDRAGVTAAFNLNVLAHLNRRVGTDFSLSDWRHQALFNAGAGRIEMYLEAAADLWVMWPGGGRHFRRGERIHTENSYKYSVEGFAALLGHAGFARHACWTDARHWFAIFLAQP